MKRYELYMQEGFSNGELQNVLGSEVVDSLVEWADDKFRMTKERLVQMIEIVHGYDCFKDKSFREQLLNCMPDEELASIYKKINKTGNYDRKTAISIISNKTWGNNVTSLMLADCWELPPDCLTKPVDTLSPFDSNATQFSPKRFFELLDYQYCIKQRVDNLLSANERQERLLIHMPTGTGKTKTAMHIITNYINNIMPEEGLVIWLAHSTELIDQAMSTFYEVWGHLGSKAIQVHSYWGNEKVTTGDISGIVFAGVQKALLIKKNQPVVFEELKKKATLIVFDEAHKAAAAETRLLLDQLMLTPAGYPNKALIGLTATPGRSTELSLENSILTGLFGNRLISVDTNLLNEINHGALQALNETAENNIIRYFQNRKILSRIIPEKLVYQQEFSDEDLIIIERRLQFQWNSDKDYSAKQLEVFAKNRNRNLAIITRLLELNNEHVPTIVFACSVNHARLLSAFLTIKNVPNALVYSDMLPQERRNAIDQFKDRTSGIDIIINYGVLTTGFDSTNIKCVMITRPTQSIVLYSQMLGRGLRGPKMGGNEECLLIDIEDNLSTFNHEETFSHFDAYWKEY